MTRLIPDHEWPPVYLVQSGRDADLIPSRSPLRAGKANGTMTNEKGRTHQELVLARRN